MGEYYRYELYIEAPCPAVGHNELRGKSSLRARARIVLLDRFTDQLLLPKTELRAIPFLTINVTGWVNSFPWRAKWVTCRILFPFLLFFHATYIILFLFSRARWYVQKSYQLAGKFHIPFSLHARTGVVQSFRSGLFPFRVRLVRD